MPYRNKVYVAFDGDKDIHYYRLMKAWKQNDHTDFDFNDAHDLRQARDSSTEESIKSNLRTRLANSKIFVLLIGESTRYLYKFVRWEMEQAISRDLPIVAVNLNGKKSIDNDRCPPILSNHLVLHVNFGSKILQKALEVWGDGYYTQKNQGDSGPFYFKDETYQSIEG